MVYLVPLPKLPFATLTLVVHVVCLTMNSRGAERLYIFVLQEFGNELAIVSFSSQIKCCNNRAVTYSARL